MATNIPFTGRFKVSYPYKVKDKRYIAGFHTGIDLIGITNIKVYSTCDGTIYKVGYSAKDYGNYVVIKSTDGVYHWLCHLASTSVKVGQKVTRTSIIGMMGATGKVTGAHTHYEIRNSTNEYGKVLDVAEYMGIPNKEGIYDSADYSLEKIAKKVENVEKVVDNSIYYPKCLQSYASIVDALNSIQVNSSLANRKKIAIKNGIENYKGTVAQNTELLKKLKAGTLLK